MSDPAAVRKGLLEQEQYMLILDKMGPADRIATKKAVRDLEARDNG